MIKRLNITILLLVLICLSCSKNHDQIKGIWQVASPFYSATYQIVEENDSLKSKVLYYNDGTTLYKAKDDPKIYYNLHNLIEKEGIYIDAVSGATKTKKNKTTSIEILHPDTLEVSSYIANNLLKEIWTRKQ